MLRCGRIYAQWQRVEKRKNWSILRNFTSACAFLPACKWTPACDRLINGTNLLQQLWGSCTIWTIGALRLVQMGEWVTISTISPVWATALLQAGVARYRTVGPDCALNAITHQDVRGLGTWHLAERTSHEP